MAALPPVNVGTVGHVDHDDGAPIYTDLPTLEIYQNSQEWDGTTVKVFGSDGITTDVELRYVSGNTFQIVEPTYVGFDPASAEEEEPSPAIPCSNRNKCHMTAKKRKKVNKLAKMARKMARK